MTYSCSDFTDSIIEALNVEIPEEFIDDPSEQATICIEEIERLQRLAGTTGNGDPITRALAHLHAARDLLKEADCPRATEKVRRALKSAEGAQRNAGVRAQRTQPPPADGWHRNVIVPGIHD